MNSFKFKKVRPARALACLLVLMTLLTAFAALAEPAAQSAYMPQEVTDPDEIAAAVQEASEQDADPEINVLEGLKSIAMSTGFAKGEWRQYAMIAVIAAAIAAFDNSGKTPVVRKVRRVSGWNRAAREEQVCRF